MPARIAAFLHTLRILLGYGRHLAETVGDRATLPGFSLIGACFGTARLPVILAHLQRGILRAMALERVLLLRAASGRDIALVEPRIRTRSPPPLPTDAPTAEAASAQTAAARPARKAGSDDPTVYMPTLEELVARARRRNLGQTIVEICLDLAVIPGLCTGPFWNEVFGLVYSYGGSLVVLMDTRCRREIAFQDEQDKGPVTGRVMWAQTREAIRKALGFLVGETPMRPAALSPAPCVPAAAMATGPP